MTATRLHPAVAAIAVASAMVAAGCSEPTAQVVQLPNTHFTYQLPAEFTDIGVAVDEEPGFAYGLPGSTPQELSSEPVFLAGTLPSGELASFQSLRLLATGGEFDPLDESLDPLPNDTQLLAYAEYGEPDVWGIRLRMAFGRGAADFQALVDRRSDQVVVTELICTQACFIEQIELIDEIQASWSLET